MAWRRPPAWQSWADRLRCFSGLSERLGPEAMVALLNRYLGAMTEVIVRHRGMIRGKRVPEERVAALTTKVSVGRLEITHEVELEHLESVVLELDLAGHGWTRSVYAKVVAVGPGWAHLAITSLEPGDLEALRRVAGAKPDGA